MIQIDVIWAGLWVAVTVNDNRLITYRRGLTPEHARQRLIRALG